MDIAGSRAGILPVVSVEECTPVCRAAGAADCGGKRPCLLCAKAHPYGDPTGIYGAADRRKHSLLSGIYLYLCVGILSVGHGLDAAGPSGAVFYEPAAGGRMDKQRDLLPVFYSSAYNHDTACASGGVLCGFSYPLHLQKRCAKNLLPSIHCLESWLCFRNALRFKGVPRWYLPLTALMTLLVFASTLLVKQHVLVDVPAGILAAELGLFLANKCRLGGLIERLEAPFLNKQAA